MYIFFNLEKSRATQKNIRKIKKQTEIKYQVTKKVIMSYVNFITNC